MDIKKLWLFLALRTLGVVALLVILTSPSSGQETTYTYSGNAYQTIGFSSPAVCPVTVSFTTTEPLPSNSNLNLHDNPLLKNFSISNCFNTVTDKNQDTFFEFFFIITDGDGKIQYWSVGGVVDQGINVQVTPTLIGGPFTATRVSVHTVYDPLGKFLGSQVSDFTFYDNYPNRDHRDATNSNSNSPGVWTGSGSCRASVKNWKQFTPWGSNDYDQSYISALRYTTRSSTPVSRTGRMELQNGTSTFGIPLTVATNNLDGLATLISAIPGTNALIGGSPGNFYLSVYNTRCDRTDCFPRPVNGLHLCDGTCATGTDILAPKTMSAYGCGVTALALVLDYVKIASIQEAGGPQPLDPLELNEFMSNTIDLTRAGGLFNSEGNVDWLNTPRFVGANQQNSKFTFDAGVELDDALCTDHLPVIEKVTSPHGTSHFVVVTGKQGSATDGSQYSIQDPGYSDTTLQNYFQRIPAPSVVGVVRDPADLSEFNVSVGDNGDLLLIDANGRRTGFDDVSGQEIRDIPSSAYLRTQTGDDESGDTTTGLTHSVQVRTGVEGSYTLSVLGLQLGPYAVTVHSYSQDGTAAPVVSVPGVASLGSTASFQIGVSSSGGVAAVTRLASFQTTLDDISNCVQLGLIDNAGIANSLSTKILAAQKSVGASRDKILNAFEKEVNAQAGKHITGVAPDVLLQDADSLIASR